MDFFIFKIELNREINKKIVGNLSEELDLCKSYIWWRSV